MAETLPSITEFLDRADPTCPRCGGGGLVCEEHPDRLWPDEHHCGAGMPCACTERRS